MKILSRDDGSAEVRKKTDVDFAAVSWESVYGGGGGSGAVDPEVIWGTSRLRSGIFSDGDVITSCSFIAPAESGGIAGQGTIWRGGEKSGRLAVALVPTTLAAAVTLVVPPTPMAMASVVPIIITVLVVSAAITVAVLTGRSCDSYGCRAAGIAGGIISLCHECMRSIG